MNTYNQAHLNLLAANALQLVDEKHQSGVKHDLTLIQDNCEANAPFVYAFSKSGGFDASFVDLSTLTPDAFKHETEGETIVTLKNSFNEQLDWILGRNDDKHSECGFFNGTKLVPCNAPYARLFASVAFDQSLKRTNLY